MNGDMEYKSFKITIDGRASHRFPVKLHAFRCPYESFEPSGKLMLDKTVGPRASSEDDTSEDPPTSVLFLVQDNGLGERLGNWAIQYSTFFARSSSQVTLMTSAHLIGLAYVAKALPEVSKFALLFLIEFALTFSSMSWSPWCCVLYP